MVTKRVNFSYLNFIKTYWKNILIIMLCGFINAFACVVLLYSSSTIPNGLDSISFALSYIFPETVEYMMLIYFTLNLPLILFFWNKIKREFILLTLIYLIINGLFGIMFGQTIIKNFFINDVFHFVSNGNDWNDANGGSTNIVYEGWPIFIYVLITVGINSPTNALLWKNGASTGGTDIIAYYISVKKKKNVGKFIILIGYSFAFISIIILVYLKNKVASKNTINGFKHIGGLQTISTFIFIFVDGLIVNILYPKYKKVKVKIELGNDYYSFTKWLLESEYYHPYKIVESISGFTKEKKYSIETIMLFLECEDFVKKAHEIDPKLWISVSPISKIIGRFNYSHIE